MAVAEAFAVVGGACRPVGKDMHENFADAVHGAGALNVEGVNFIEVDQEELIASEDVPEYIEIDVAAGSGAGDHVLSRVDAPGHPVQESRAHGVARSSKVPEGTSWTTKARFSWR